MSIRSVLLSAAVAAVVSMSVGTACGQSAATQPAGPDNASANSPVAPKPALTPQAAAATTSPAAFMMAPTTAPVAAAPSAASDGQPPSAVPAPSPAAPSAGGPTTVPSVSAAGAPTTAPAVISTQAQAMLDQLSSAYLNVKSLQTSGSMSVNIDVDGRKSQQNSPFTSSFQAPNLFKHDTPGDMVYGSTGEKGYFYLPAKHAYVWTDAPAARCRIDEIPGDLSGAVCNTDISIGLAISTDPGKEISDGAATVSKAPDVVLAGKAYPALLVTSSDADVTVAIDPETHLVRQFRVDLAKSARERGAQIVNAATFVMDYADTTLNPALKSDEFAWSPPAGSQEIRPQAQVLSEQFAGKPAPAFNLPGLDGKTVSSRELKGSAYILDFWATWCGPCRQELPDLDKIYQDLKSSGLKAFAVDQGEDKDTVTKFVEDTKLTIPALLDADMSVGAAFGASAIPETVLIGKDGKVIKVFTAPFSMDDLRSAAEAAAKGQ